MALPYLTSPPSAITASGTVNSAVWFPQGQDCTLTRIIAASALGVWMSACNGEQDFNPLVPEITVAPAQLDFGEQGVLLSTTEILYISNGGRVPLELDMQLEGPNPETFSWSADEDAVAPGETLPVEITFSPQTFLDFSAELTLNSNDLETPQVRVPLTGIGIDEPLPDISLTTLSVDFGDVDTGAEQTQYVTLRNEGRAPLNLGTFVQTGSGAFRLGFDPSGQQVAPDNELPLILSFLPTQSEGDSGTLIIPSDDPDESSVVLVMLGNGGGSFEYPEAHIDCPGSSEPPTHVSLDGSASMEPGGNTPLSFNWELIKRPSYSQGDLSDTITEKTDLFTDVAGDYSVQLVVTNSIGIQSAPARCDIAAIPADDLHVELTWDTAMADLDLHLLEDGGSFFEKPGDCTFCNPNPSWGGSGGDDNPRLDLDDRQGYGPENINIKHPENGKFHIKAHYYDDQGDSAVVATVRIYTYGILESELSRVLFRNELWDVAQVNWPAGTVGVLSNTATEPEVRSCY